MPRRTDYFQYGSFHHGNDLLENINEREFDSFVKKFINKFWGNVNNEQWQANNLAADEDSGEIRAMYIDENGREIHFITFEDRNFTVIATKKDLDNGVIEDLKRRIEDSQVRKAKARRMFSEGA